VINRFLNLNGYSGGRLKYLLTVEKRDGCISDYCIGPIEETAFSRIVLPDVFEYIQHSVIQRRKYVVMVDKELFTQSI